MKVGDLVKLKTSPDAYRDKLVGELGTVIKVSPNGCNLTVQFFNGGYIGLLAWSWFEVISASR